MLSSLEREAQEPIVIQGWFAASPERVFRAWTDPSLVVQWFGRSPDPLYSAEIDLRVGGAWRFVKTQEDDRIVALQGTYLEIQLNRRLVFTWALVETQTDDNRKETLHAEIDVEFAAKGEGTSVSLTHSPMRARDSRSGIGRKWQLSFCELDHIL